jgi:peptide/nickel transport system substrate-binding protein
LRPCRRAKPPGALPRARFLEPPRKDASSSARSPIGGPARIRPAEGGWNAFCSFSTSSDFSTPATHFLLRGNGEKAFYGWPSSPRLEALRDAWFDAPDLAGQKKIEAEIQAEAFVDAAYIPLGVFYNPRVYRRDVTYILHGFPIFWNMRRA